MRGSQVAKENCKLWWGKQALGAYVVSTISVCGTVAAIRYHTATIPLLAGEESKIVVVPNFADSVSEGDVRWEKAVGDQVSVDEVVVEIETDKIHMLVAQPEHSSSWQLACQRHVSHVAGSSLHDFNRPASKSHNALFSCASGTRGVSNVRGAGMSKHALLVADYVYFSITQTSVAVPAPENGIIEELFVEDGATVKAGQKLFKLKVTAAGAPASKPKEAAAPAPPPPTAASAPPPPPPSTNAHPPPATPPPPTPPPSAPKTQIPVAAIRHAQALENASVKTPPADPTKEISGTRSIHRVKMSRMRVRIAERLKESQNTAAMLTTFNELDMTNIMEFRKTHQDAFTKKHGIKLGFMSPFLKASAYALQDQPVVNAVIEGNEIVYRDFVDISVAVATPKGLVVPVVHNVDAMTYAEIELKLVELGEKARKGALSVEESDGGTFTVSNGGVFGSLMGTPIINPPQSAILGMHGVFERPVAIKGQVVIRPMMYIALTYDHRLIDGREAVLFLRKIKVSCGGPKDNPGGAIRWRWD
uniref:Dihydrolipoyllysine-residue succinyltransferase component of 2-oxoglutarate dehydrogenase complex, mitochondrial n=1 Tax=Timema bartmani TaxID=61472 RepID=A0A7R9EYK6_9NEOP|nr:unnamed protein product [Timema bartmani]